MGFLTTKLYRPRTRPNMVVRARLFEQLDQALVNDIPLILVSAPPGFGKSTLVSAWAGHTNLPFAWVSLDETDNAPNRFWGYLASALKTVLPDLDTSQFTSSQPVQSADPGFFRQELLNQLAALNRPFLLALDDYHLIENPLIHNDLDYFINHIKSVGHVVLLTRADPPIHIPRRRARGELVEIRAMDLRFTNAEAAEFLRNCMALELSEEDIYALDNRTEGWITGLQLAAVTLRTIEDRHSFIQAFHGDDRLVTDYLIEEVLLQQSADRQSFLLQTSVLGRFNTHLCNALTGRIDSAQLLAQMENENLFLIPLDNQREWFRYHALFARLLRKKLEQTIGQQGMRQLLQRASEECVHQGFLVEAVQYMFLSGDESGAAALIARHAQEIFAINELPMLMHWSTRLPDRIVSQMPGLCLSLGWASHATGNPEKSQHFVRLVEGNIGVTVDAFLARSVEEQQALPKEVLASIIEAAVLQARLDIDREISLETLERYNCILPWLVPERDREPYANNVPSAMRPAMTFQMGMAYAMLGKPSLAVPALEESIQLSRHKSNHFLVALGLGYLGQVQAEQGRLYKAEETWQEALDYAREFGLEKNAFFSVALAGLASLAYERNELSRAEQLLGEGIRLARTWPAWQGLLPGYILLAKVRLANGDSSGAEKALDELGCFSRTAPQIINPAIEACRAWLWICQDLAGKAAAWLQSRQPLNLDQRLVQVWGLVKLGEPSIALKKLDRIISEAENAGLNGYLVRGLALKAFAQYASGRMEHALISLHQALKLAESEGYVRTFVDLDGPMEILLKKRIPPQFEVYALRLRSAFLRSTDSADASRAMIIAAEQANSRLSNPLTQRELEILRMLVAELDNEAIAKALYISIHTVKKHFTHIFEKLGVDNRLQAVKEARRLGLLP